MTARSKHSRRALPSNDNGSLTLRRTTSAWSNQFRSLHALIVREMMMRYGREHLGFVWVILEPMLLTAAVLVLWTLLKGQLEHGVQVIELTLTGYMMLTLWRHTTNCSIMLFRRSVHLLYHARVTPLDLLLARIGLEFIASTAALFVVFSTLWLLDIISPVEDWSLALGGWFMMFGLGTGVALLILAATEANETAEKFIQPVQYILVPISGTFFMVDWFPEGAQRLLLINPLIHCYELFRSGFFGSSVPTHYSLPYVGSWVFLLLFIGLFFANRTMRNIQIA